MVLKLSRLAIGIVCSIFATQTTQAQPRSLCPPDLVLLNGKVITMDPASSIVEAVAIGHGHILAVGSTKDIQLLVDEHTKVIQLAGRSVLPGFIDAHTHLEGIADFHRMLDIHAPPLSGVGEILQKVAERVQASKPGEWIVGAGGWGQPMPTRKQIDVVAPNNPVVLRESAHVQTLNTRGAKRYRHRPEFTSRMEFNGFRRGGPRRLTLLLSTDGEESCHFHADASKSVNCWQCVL